MDCNNCSNGTEADGEEADTDGDYATETWVHYGSILAGKMWSMYRVVSNNLNKSQKGAVIKFIKSQVMTEVN